VTNPFDRRWRDQTGSASAGGGERFADQPQAADARHARRPGTCGSTWDFARRLTYRVERWDSQPRRQVVRLADDVLARSGHGCCIDLVLLLAGALKHVQIFPARHPRR